MVWFMFVYNSKKLVTLTYVKIKPLELSLKIFNIKHPLLYENEETAK